jgi:hypothetical protein
MKKTAISILLALCTASLFGQTAYDALMLSENSYEGTARSVAMGNAFTALGGDLGAVTINPAGSAMAPYSQVTITPGITIATTTTKGVSPYENGELPYFQRTLKSNLTKANIPNLGFTLNFDTGRKYGLVSWTMGFIVNKTADYNQDVYANGVNSTTSFIGRMAYDASAAGYFPDELGSSNAYDSGIPWKYVTGYQSAMFDPFNDIYVAATEKVYDDNTCFVAGELDQSYGRRTSGSKYEYIVNAGLNFNDVVYVGINLGMNTLSYDYTHYFKEGAHSDIHDFENIFIDNQGVEHVTYFDKAKYNYSYNADGSGVFAKFGIIVAPGNGFRFGAAVQTPTATTIRETWQEKAETKFSDSSFDGYAESELGRSEYTYRSPWRANFGLAYTLGNFAVVSADYELAGYGGMRYKIDRHEMSDGDIDYFETVNEDIRNMYGAAHYLRAGVEVKPLSYLSVRGGYNLATSAQVAEYDADEDEYYSIDRTYRHNVSLGLGFSSKKSFFADLACRYDLPQKEYIIPYSDYLASTGGALNPEILNRHSSWKVLLTLGWRF